MCLIYLQYVIIPTRRATAAAFQILVCHIFGDASSPFIVGLVFTYSYSDLQNLPFFFNPGKKLLLDFRCREAYHRFWFGDFPQLQVARIWTVRHTLYWSPRRILLSRLFVVPGVGSSQGHQSCCRQHTRSIYPVLVKLTFHISILSLSKIRILKFSI